MKTRYFKLFCKISIAMLVFLFYQQAFAANAPVKSLSAPVNPADSTKKPKVWKLRKAKKIKKDDDKDQEDGVDDDIRARAHQEFLQQRDPKLNRVPVERLLTARKLRDQLIAAHVAKAKAATPQGNAAKLPGNAPTSPVDISGLQWHERGPNNVGGRTRALIFDMADSLNGYKKVFAGGVGGGLWVTSDITATPVQWTKINDFFDNIAISCIAQNPVNPKEIYVATGEGFLNADAIQGLGVWKSSDGGATWAQLPSTTGFIYINAILVDRNGSVYIAGESAIFVGFGVDQSTDGGNTWTNVINSAEAGADLQMAANGDVYASTGVISLYGHIYISDFTVNGVKTGNAGTWTNITPETTGVITPATTSWNRIKLAMAPSDPNIVYAFFEVDYYSSSGKTNLASVQQYNKSANTWTVKTVPSEAFSNGQAWYSIAAAVDPNNPSVLYAGSLDAEKSVDGGQTWTQYTSWDASTTSSNYVHADHHAYVYFPGSSTRMMMGTDGGVFYTVNADVTPSFVNKNNGYDVTQFYSVALHPTDYNYALAGAQDNGSEKFSSAGLGPTSVATGGDGADVFIDQTNGNIQVTSYVYDNYYVSTDNGATFNGLGSYGYGSFINPTDYDPATKSLYAGSYTGYYYRAAGITTSPAYDLVSVSGFNGANITTVAVAPITANRVYFGLDNGTIVLVDNAQTGTSQTGVVLMPNGAVASGGAAVDVSCIAVDPTSEDHLLVTYSNYGVTHIFETRNASAATPVWTAVDGNYPDMPANWALFYPGDPTKAVIATEMGVWTTNLLNGSSTTWDPANTGFANVRVDMLKYRAADQTLAAATHGRGVFTSTLPNPSAPSIATLSKLTISSGTLTPAFATATTSYTDVAHAVSSIAFRATTTDPLATETINGTAVPEGTVSPYIPLNVGVNNISVVVTAQNGITQDTYTIAVTRLPNIATLSKLTISSGTLTPAFATATTSYTDVAHAVSSIAFRATTTDALATETINGTAVPEGTVSPYIPLSVGVNNISVVITAQDGVTTDTYTIAVTRLPEIATLSKLTTSSGALSPAFASGTTSYTDVAHAVSSIAFRATTTDALATETINGTAVPEGTVSPYIPLSVGVNNISVVITAQDGVTTDTYTIAVTRLPEIATLSKLTISSGTLTPAFATATTSYTDVAHAVSSIAFRATTTDALATETINGTAVPEGTVSPYIPLTAGVNNISIVVTAQDGVTQDTYTVAVTRLPNVATLSKLTVSSGTLTPAFATATTGYTDNVANTVSSIAFRATTTDALATETINGTAVPEGAVSFYVPLSVGMNKIPIIVTAQDGVTTEAYTITVTRAAPPVVDAVYQPVSVEITTETPQLEDDIVIVHQGVSPNGDGVDDFLQIDGILAFPDNRLMIMNRNGMLVYEAKGYDNASKVFDGHSNKNGAMQLPGTYFYSLDYTVNGITKHKTGFLVLKY
jgi:gliding motility-associated-like protein